MQERASALNEMAGFTVGDHDATLAPLQVRAVKQFVKFYQACRNRVGDWIPSRAYQVLLGAKGGYTDDPVVSNPGSVAVYKRGTVKFPSASPGVQDLVEILPTGWRNWLADSSNLLRDPLVARPLIDALPSGCALDVVLRRRTSGYGWFLSDL